MYKTLHLAISASKCPGGLLSKTQVGIFKVKVTLGGQRSLLNLAAFGGICPFTTALVCFLKDLFDLKLLMLNYGPSTVA